MLHTDTTWGVRGIVRQIRRADDSWCHLEDISLSKHNSTAAILEIFFLYSGKFP